MLPLNGDERLAATDTTTRKNNETQRVKHVMRFIEPQNASYIWNNKADYGVRSGIGWVSGGRAAGREPKSSVKLNLLSM